MKPVEVELVVEGVEEDVDFAEVDELEVDVVMVVETVEIVVELSAARQGPKRTRTTKTPLIMVIK